MEKFFKLKEHGTSVRTEITAGITTFLAMAYILAVNPSMLAIAGMNQNAVLIATALSACVATLCMAFLANYPIALASGMGLNAFFTFSVCLGMGVSWQVALTAVLVEGIIFIIMSFFRFRETLVNTVPENLKYGITAGIGLFIGLIGFKGAGIVIDDPATLVNLGSLLSPQVILALVGLLLIGFLHQRQVKGAILIGILATWILGMAAQAVGWYVVNPEAGAFSLYPNFSNWSLIPAVPAGEGTFFKFDFTWAFQNIVKFAIIVFTFLFVDIFDTVGTLIGVASKGNLLDKEGKLPRVGSALMADAVGTVAGACFGTSTVTSYVESSAGVAEGGRTGLTSLTTGILFLLAIPFYPIFTAIPGFATAPALIFVGLMMISAVKKMHFDGDMADALGGFLAIVMMPFTYSIANGIMFGMLAWVILKICSGKIKQIHPVMWIATALFILRIFTV